MKTQQPTIVQVQLSNPPLTLITWVDKKPNLKKGAFISLDECPEARWEVKEVYPGEHPNHAFQWHRKWDNNI
jgi:hypothetical protein